MVNEPLQHDAYGEEFKGLRIPETFNTRRLGLLQPLSDKFHSWRKSQRNLKAECLKWVSLYEMTHKCFDDPEFGRKKFATRFVFETKNKHSSNLPHPFSPKKPYLRPQFNSSFVSVKSSTPWKVMEKFSIFTSRDCSCEAKTPVHERFDKSNFTEAPFSVAREFSTPFSVASVVGFGLPLDWAAAFFFAWRFFAASEGIVLFPGEKKWK